MLHFLDLFFIVFHTLWMVFNCIGWIWKRTRPWQLATVILTAFSWFVMGIWNGWGYCLCTDWHWQIREKLGYPDDHSYTHLLFLQLTGIDVNPGLADVVTASVFAVVALLGIVLSARDFLKRNKAKNT
jgi:hypothetical protein